MFPRPEQPISAKHLLLLLGSFFLIAFVSLLRPTPAPAAPPITWTPSSLTTTIAPGSTHTLQVSFHSSRRLRNIAVRVVPELEPFVEITPEAFDILEIGESRSLLLTISAPATSVPDFVEGVIQLRNANPPRNVLSGPLPLAINFWPLIAFGEINVAHPPEWQFIENAEGISFMSPSTVTRYEALGEDAVEVPPDIGLVVLPNEDSKPIALFGDTFADGYYATYAFREEQVVNNRAAVRYDDSRDTFPQLPVIAVFVDAGPDVILVVLNRHVADAESRMVFDDLVGSLTILGF